MYRTITLLLLLLPTGMLRAQTTDDDRYAVSFGITGIQGTVSAAVEVGSDVYVAGRFNLAGDVQAHNIVRWNRMSRTFHPVGAGLYTPYYEAENVSYLHAVGDYLYASGYFRYAGEQPANGLARLHVPTGTWEAVDVGQGESDFQVGPIASVGGDVYVSYSRYLRRYTPATGAWSEVAELGTTAAALAAIGTDLYVSWAFAGTEGALLADADGTGLNRIGRYDTQGGTWHPLGAGAANGLALMNAACYDPATGKSSNYQTGVASFLLPHAGKLYVGGQFGEAGGVPVNSLAFYDPADDTWHDLGGGLRFITTNAYEQTVCDYPAQVEGMAFDDAGAFYAAGYFARAGTGDAALYSTDSHPLFRWTAAGGWEGTGIHRARGVFHLDGASLLVHGDDLRWKDTLETYGAMEYDAASKTAHLLNAQNAQGTRSGSITKLKTGPGGALYALASGYGIGTLQEAGLVRWNGSAWESAAPPMPGCYLADFVFDDDGTLYGGGRTDSFETWNGRATRPCAMRLRDGAWTMLPGENLVGYHVDAVALSGDTLFVGGNIGGLLDGDGNVVEGSEGILRYTLTTGRWGSVGTGVDLLNDTQNGTVHTLAVDPVTGHLWAGGYFDVAGGSTISSLARWDGTRWTGIGGAVLEDYGSAYPGTVRALAFANGALYVGGTFSHMGTKAIPSLARYDFASKSWSGFGDGLRLDTRAYPDINALVVRGGEVIVGGYIHRSSERYGLNNVARWDGQAWMPLGSGVTNVPEPGGGLSAYASSLALVGDALWIGGGFELAGGKPSVGVARYTLPPVGTGGAATAEVQLLHGSAALAAYGPLEVYVGESATPRAVLRFGGGTSYLTLPADAPLVFKLRLEQEPPPWLPREFSFSATLSEGRHVLSLAGVPDVLENVFAANPDGISTYLRLLEQEIPASSGKGADAQFVLVHAVTDAPALGVFVEETNSPITYYFPYASVSEPVSLPAGRYRLRFERNADRAVLGTFDLDLTGRGGQTVPVLFTGFLDPAANQSGPGLLLAAVDEQGVSTGVVDSDGAISDAIGQPFPNPAREFATVRVEIPGAAEARLYDALGRHVSTTARPSGTAGDLRVDTSTLAPGVYVLRITAGTAHATRCVTVVR